MRKQHYVFTTTILIAWIGSFKVDHLRIQIETKTSYLGLVIIFSLILLEKNEEKTFQTLSNDFLWMLQENVPFSNSVKSAKTKKTELQWHHNSVETTTHFNKDATILRLEKTLFNISFVSKCPKLTAVASVCYTVT